MVTLSQAVLLASVSLVSGVVGFFAKRRITDAKTRERADLLNSLADLHAKLSGSDAALAQIKELERMVRDGKPLSESTVSAIVGEAEMPPQYWTQIAMSSRAGARLAVVKSQVAEAFIELDGLLHGQNRQKWITEAEEKWGAYLEAEMALARSEYEGGSIAPMAGAVRGIQLCEDKLADLQRIISGYKSDPR